MAAGEREQVLADFQACTQLDDIETCIAILDQHDWNLVKAINSVMHDNQMDSPIAGDPIQFSSFLRPPGESNFFTTGIFSDPVPLRENNIADSMAHFDPGSASGPGPSSTGNTPRMLHFNVEYRERNVNVYVADNEPVARIKEILAAELAIPVGKQELRGWTNRKVYDNKILRELHLPKENTLFLLTPEISQPTVSKPLPSSSALSSEDDSSSKMFCLNVIFKEGNGVDKQYTLNFEGSDTVRQVKESVADVTDVPVRHQIWTGWPDAAKKNDSMKLAVCSLSQPYHTLELSKANVFSKKKTAKPTDAMDLENSEDELVSESYSVDDESDLFLSEDALIRKKLQPLMPESVNDEMEALEHFTREFRERYGECHPVFYVGSLDNAIKDSLSCKAKDRKMLAIYLHHDGSILSNVFCSQILCSEGVVNYLTSNFTVWAWDMTHETNSDRLFTMATRHFGSVVATQVRGYQPDDLPVLLIITKSRSAVEVVDVVRGNEDIDGLMTHLIQDYEVFREQQKTEIVEEVSILPTC
ncbi:hypothetical protein CHS0354_006994 [Potamilus streckersoni]|uniref:Ubiquitin-like domain-containing protein n=1 Tax=Potamilus streckersoni TaxID=2493646 RepID=A0AAE0VL95_9BIVA|nr:hypothetical protein CHS0354_006994 [Potamilus streckersoni]